MRLTAKYATSEADAQAMRRVRNTCTPFMTRDRRKITANEQRLWFKLMDRTKVWPFAFYQRGKVVGYGLIRRDGNALWLSGGLLPSRRGKGLGTELFAFLVGYAIGIRAAAKAPVCKFCNGTGEVWVSRDDDHMRNRRVDCEKCPERVALLKLEVFVDNLPARKMYEKLGFVHCGSLPLRTHPGGVNLMEFPLP